MRRIPLYVDLAFCLVLLPLTIYMLPVERWWGTRPMFFAALMAWLYVTYFIYRYAVVPQMFHGGRLRWMALGVVALTLLVTFLFGSYEIHSPYYHLHSQATDTLPFPVWGIRQNQQAVWIHFIVVVCFCFAVGMLSEAYRQRHAREELEQSARAAEERLQRREALAGADANGDRQLLLKSEYKTVAVALDAIVYIESVGNYAKVHQDGSPAVLSKIPLRALEGQLPAGEFLRIHRSFIVARSRIARFTRSEITLSKSGQLLPMGKKYAEDALRQLENRI